MTPNRKRPGHGVPRLGDRAVADHLITTETICVLESFYETPRAQIADAMRSLLAFDTITCVDPALLLRAIEVYEVDRIDFAEAYLVACAESTGVSTIASFDRSLDRVTTVTRLEPPAPPPGQDSRANITVRAKVVIGGSGRSTQVDMLASVRSHAASNSPSGPINRGGDWFPSRVSPPCHACRRLRRRWPRGQFVGTATTLTAHPGV